MNQPLYVMQFTSWENDDNDYQKTQLIVETKEDKKFYYSLAKLFGFLRSTGMGNEDSEEKTTAQIIREHMAEHPLISTNTKSVWEEAIKNSDAYATLCDKILGEPVNYDWGYCRVIESVNVTKMNCGDWITTPEHGEAVYVGLNGGQIQYRYSDYPIVNGQPDIFKRIWPIEQCDIEDTKFKAKANNISKQVVISAHN